MENEKKKKKVVGIKELARLVSEQESDINGLALLVSEQERDISALESKLEVFENDLDDKASQSDLSDLDDRVGEVEDKVNDYEERVDKIDELVEKVEELQSAHAVIEDMRSTVAFYCDKVIRLETLVKLLITKLPDSVLVALVGEKYDLK